MAQKLYISQANLAPIENQGCNLIKNFQNYGLDIPDPVSA